MDSPSGLRAVFLGSGSAGNCTAIAYRDTLVLVDCGFSARETARRLVASGLDPGKVTGILVTHEHGDHVRGIDVFTRRHAPGCPTYASVGTVRSAGPGTLGTEVRTIRPGEQTRVGDLELLAFRTSHDAAEPLGFRISGGDESVGIVTDTGVLTPEAIETLAGVGVLGIESNHDVEMLENGPYPYHLKRRISSSRGHLSNAAAAHALEMLASDSLARVVSLHRSRTNNTAALARAALKERVRRIGLTAVVEIVEQDGSATVS